MTDRTADRTGSDFTYEYQARSGITIRHSDGGRKRAGYKGSAGDCVVRAIALAFEQTDDYKLIYRCLAAGQKVRGRPRSARNGVQQAVSGPFLTAHGAKYTDLSKTYGKPLLAGSFPEGRFIVATKGHYAAVLDGILYDTHDSTYKRTRGGGVLLRPIVGFWDCNASLPINGGLWRGKWISKPPSPRPVLEASFTRQR